MTNLFLAVMSRSIVLAFVTTILLFGMPFLRKRYSVHCLYVMWCIVIFAYLIPFGRIAILPSGVEIASSSTDTKEETMDQGKLVTMDHNFMNQSELQSNMGASEMEYEYTSNSYHKENIFISIYQFISSSKMLNILSWIWVTGVGVCLLLSMMKHTRYLHMIKKNKWMQGNQENEDMLKELTNQLNVHKKIVVYQSKAISSPITTGLYKFIIWMPVSEYQEYERQYLLKHELVHIKHRDSVWKVLKVLCICCNWFNPFVYMAARQMDLACESACDRKVLKNSDKKECFDYARLLLRIATVDNTTNNFSMLSFTGGNKDMKKRLNSVTDQKKRKFSIGMLSAVLVSSMAFTFISVNANSKADASDAEILTQNCEKTESEKESETIEAVPEDKQAATLTSEPAQEGSQADTLTSEPAQEGSQEDAAASVPCQEENSMCSSMKSNEVDNTYNIDRQQIVDSAKNCIGLNYCYGGKNPETGFDCSGFVDYVYEQNLIPLVSTTNGLYQNCRVISREELQPGDLVFYDNAEQAISHVAIYLGDDKVVHAKNMRYGVYLESIDYRNIAGYGSYIK